MGRSPRRRHPESARSGWAASPPCHRRPSRRAAPPRAVQREAAPSPAPLPGARGSSVRFAARQPPKAKSAAPVNAAAARVPTASTQSAALASTSRPTRGVGLEEPTRCCRPSPASNTRRRQVKWHVTALGDTVGKRLLIRWFRVRAPEGTPSSQLRGQSHVLSSDGRADALYPAADRRPGVYGLIVTATPASLGRARPLYRAD